MPLKRKYRKDNIEYELKNFTLPVFHKDEKVAVPVIQSRELHEKVEIPTFCIKGSYNSDNNRYSYGVCGLLEDGTELRFAEGFYADLEKGENHIAGEIAGIKTVIRYSIEHNIKKIIIAYNYKYIEKWCTGDKMPKLEYAKELKRYYNEIKDKLSIEFVDYSVKKDHSQNKIADSLSKYANGLKSGRYEIDSINF